jgi:hypothetical protein
MTKGTTDNAPGMLCLPLFLPLLLSFICTRVPASFLFLPFSYSCYCSLPSKACYMLKCITSTNHHPSASICIHLHPSTSIHIHPHPSTSIHIHPHPAPSSSSPFSSLHLPFPSSLSSPSLLFFFPLSPSHFIFLPLLLFPLIFFPLPHTVLQY